MKFVSPDPYKNTTRLLQKNITTIEYMIYIYIELDIEVCYTKKTSKNELRST